MSEKDLYERLFDGENPVWVTVKIKVEACEKDDIIASIKEWYDGHEIGMFKIKVE